jgi:glycosyltransferase involved in cell wall biosynthesis
MPVFFSVVIPVYNRRDHICKLLESFARQHYRKFEILIIDDGSTDNLEDVVSPYLDPQIKYFYKENGERGAARNYGASKAVGDYITFFDSDDLVYPWFLSNAAANLEKLSSPECYAQKFEVVQNAVGLHTKAAKEDAGLISINKELLKGNMLACNGVFLRKDIAMTFRFSEDRNLSGSEDWLLWLRIAANFTFYYNKTVCSCLINHDARGELNIDSNKFQLRAFALKENLNSDLQIDKYKKAAKKRIFATYYVFAGQKFSQFKKLKIKSVSYFLMALVRAPALIVEKRVLIYARSFFFIWR